MLFSASCKSLFATKYQTELQARKIMIVYESIKNKEVIQPQVPLRLPCDDLTHLTELRFEST